MCACLGREEDDGVDARELLEDEEEARDSHELAVARAQQLPPAATHRLARLHRGHGRTRAPQPGRRLLGLGLAPRLGEVGLGLGLRLGLGLGLRLGSGLGSGLGLGFEALRPALASQRGDSGTQSKAPSCAMHGRMATANILRQ